MINLTTDKARTLKIVLSFSTHSFFYFRHPSIVPYDFNRVKLYHPIDGCDYVNASWVSERNMVLDDALYRKSPKLSFIAAQGPMLHTTEHFLQMLEDHKVDLVVMLTKLVETPNNNSECN